MSVAFKRSPTIDTKLAPSSVFLHSGWRSAGTWIWAAFRRESGVAAFCEPLHECLATLTLDGIAAWNAGGWDSRHPETAPYFEEYAPLIGPRGGVQGFRKRFSFEPYFVEPQTADDELASYLASLEHLASARGMVPVLKLARSHGRVGWMKQHFPHALHVALVRDPVGQWSSSWRLARAGTPYFLAAPLAILARSKGDYFADAFARALGVPLHRLRDFGFARTYRKCERFVRDASAGESFAAFLAFWFATNLCAIAHADLAIHSDELANDLDYRDAMREIMHLRTGIDVSFDRFDAQRPEPFDHPLAPGEIDRAKERCIETCAGLSRFGSDPLLRAAVSTLIAKF